MSDFSSPESRLGYERESSSNNTPLKSRNSVSGYPSNVLPSREKKGRLCPETGDGGRPLLRLKFLEYTTLVRDFLSEENSGD